MFQFKSEKIEKPNGAKYRLTNDGARISFSTFLKLLRTDPSFRDFFTALLSSAPYATFRWETPAVDENSRNQAFEFVVLNSPELDREANSASFEQHFRENGEANGVLSFPNIGRNAQMIVPCPTEQHSAYTHLASFLRAAPKEQIDRLWTLVGSETERLIGQQPRWLNTAGGGVPWLHIRIDSKPKYYRYAEYKSPLQEL